MNIVDSINGKVPHPKTWKYVANTLEKNETNANLICTYGIFQELPYIMKIVVVENDNFTCSGGIFDTGEYREINEPWEYVLIPDFLLK